MLQVIIPYPVKLEVKRSVDEDSRAHYFVISMITLKHIEIYLNHNGDGDGFVRCASSAEKALMKYNDWSLIESFIQDLMLLKKGLASDTYMKVIDEKLQESCDSEETIQKLKAIAEE